MQFTHHSFSCHVDVYTNESGIIVKFYDKAREQTEDQIVDLVIVDPGFGYLCLKYIGQDALLSGFLDERFFSTEEMVEDAIEYIKKLSPRSSGAYMPYQICQVQIKNCIEYNGE